MSVYGGKQQQTFPTMFKKKLDIDELDDLMYSNFLFSPCVGEMAGAPGFSLKLVVSQLVTGQRYKEVLLRLTVMLGDMLGSTSCY